MEIQLEQEANLIKVADERKIQERSLLVFASQWKLFRNQTTRAFKELCNF